MSADAPIVDPRLKSLLDSRGAFLMDEDEHLALVRIADASDQLAMLLDVADRGAIMPAKLGQLVWLIGNGVRGVVATIEGRA